MFNVLMSSLLMIVAGAVAVPAGRPAQTEQKTEPAAMAQKPGKPAKKAVFPLSPRHREWLEKDVVYIIADKEQEAFLSLESDEMRDSFIQAFWLQRDPSPGSIENEYREEHYRRIEYANSYFGSPKAQDGWRSDRGRFYIIFGEPREKTKFSGQNDIRDCELWFFDTGGKLKTVPFFRVIFFQRDFGHDYQLYDPVHDGPEALAVRIGPTREQALQFIRDRIGDELWMAAQTSLPNEPLGREWSAETTVLFSRISDMKNTLINPSWAADFIQTRGRVASRFAFRSMEMNTMLQVMYNLNRESLLSTCLSVPPEALTIGQADGRYYAAFSVRTFIDDLETQKEIISRLDHWEVDFAVRDGQVMPKPVAFEQIIPVIPGRYKLLWIVDNLVNQTFSFKQLEIDIPEGKTGEPFLPAPLLARGYEKMEGSSAVFLSPFRLFNLQYKVDATSVFNAGDNLSLFCQLLYPPALVKPGMGPVTFEIELTPVSEGMDPVPVKIEHVIPEDRAGPGGIIFFHRQIPTARLQKGRYEVVVMAHGLGGESVISPRQSFLYKGDEPLVRPATQVLATALNWMPDDYFLERARQYEQSGHSRKAVEELQAALSRMKNTRLQQRLDELLEKEAKQSR